MFKTRNEGNIVYKCTVRLLEDVDVLECEFQVHTSATTTRGACMFVRRHGKAVRLAVVCVFAYERRMCVCVTFVLLHLRVACVCVVCVIYSLVVRVCVK